MLSRLWFQLGLSTSQHSEPFPQQISAFPYQISNSPINSWEFCSLKSLCMHRAAETLHSRPLPNIIPPAQSSNQLVISTWMSQRHLKLKTSQVRFIIFSPTFSLIPVLLRQRHHYPRIHSILQICHPPCLSPSLVSVSSWSSRPVLATA